MTDGKAHGMEHAGRSSSRRLETVRSESSISLASGGMAPSSEQLARLVEAADDVESLIDLDTAISACIALARRKKVALERLTEAACWHLRARRKAGLILSETVWRGGARSKSRGATDRRGRLPKGVDKHLARRCRLLARIPEQVMEDYFDAARIQGRIPTESGLLSRAKPSVEGRRRSGSRRQASSHGLDGSTWDRVIRFLGGVDYCVGDRKAAARQHLPRQARSPAACSGTVLVVESEFPELLIPELARMRLQGSVNQVFMILPIEGLARWAGDVMRDAWSCCLLEPRRGAHLLCYHGEREHAFALIFREVGIIAYTSRTTC